MSGLWKGTKKVFRGVKKVLKKVAKPALVLGATFFISGLATGGFKGFGELLSNDGVFSAVGKTIGMGAQSVGGMLGLTEGVSAEMATAAEDESLKGRYLFDGLLGGGTQAAAERAVEERVASEARRKGILGIFQGMSDTTQYAIVNGVMGGLSAWAQSEEAEKERRRQRRQGIFGVPIGEEFGPGMSPQQLAAQIYQPQNVPQAPRPQIMPTPQQAGFANPYTTQPQQPPAARPPLLG